MVRTHVELPNGETRNLADGTNDRWYYRRTSPAMASTWITIEDLVTDAVRITTEHEPDQPADLPFEDFQEDVSEGRLVPEDMAVGQP